MKRVEIIIENLKCDGCASTITKGLNKFGEVKSVDIDIEKSSIDIEFSGDDSIVEKFKKKLAGLGYPEKGKNDTISIAKSYVSCAIGRVSG